jgi:transcriptional regulator with XRE-family HTH domain
MKVIAQIRRERLAQLKTETGLSYADMSERLGRSRRDATISQIANASPNSRTKRPRQMGDDQARAFELAFGKPVGWFDTDPELDDAQGQAYRVAEPLPSYGTPWPFRRVSASAISRLPAPALNRLEDLLLGALAMLEVESHQAAASTGTAG